MPESNAQPRVGKTEDALHVVKERWGVQVLIYAPEFPGLQVTGASEAEADALLAATIVGYRAWAADRGLARPPADACIEVDEDRSADGGIGVLFESDETMPSADFLAEAARISAAAIADIRDWCASADVERRTSLIDVADRGRAYDALGIAQHVADMDHYYLAAVGADETYDLDDPLEDLQRTQSLLWAWIRRQAEAGDSRVQIDEDGESWTVAKIIRRRIGHLREHEIEFGRLVEGDSRD